MESSIQVDPWEQLPDEPNESYEWFAKYYLALGLRRSLRLSYRLWLSENEPKTLLTRVVQSAPPPWSAAAQLFKWTERAAAFDKMAFAEAFKAVEEAAHRLRAAAPDAVDALIRELNSPRNAVAAAKEILDRAGVETAAIQRTAEFTAEDFAKANEELVEWTRTDKSSSG